MCFICKTVENHLVETRWIVMDCHICSINFLNPCWSSLTLRKLIFMTFVWKSSCFKAFEIISKFTAQITYLFLRICPYIETIRNVLSAHFVSSTVRKSSIAIVSVSFSSSSVPSVPSVRVETVSVLWSTASMVLVLIMNTSTRRKWQAKDG